MKTCHFLFKQVAVFTVIIPVVFLLYSCSSSGNGNAYAHPERSHFFISEYAGLTPVSAMDYKLTLEYNYSSIGWFEVDKGELYLGDESFQNYFSGIWPLQYSQKHPYAIIFIEDDSGSYNISVLSLENPAYDVKNGEVSFDVRWFGSTDSLLNPDDGISYRNPMIWILNCSGSAQSEQLEVEALSAGEPGPPSGSGVDLLQLVELVNSQTSQVEDDINNLLNSGGTGGTTSLTDMTKDTVRLQMDQAKQQYAQSVSDAPVKTITQAAQQLNR